MADDLGERTEEATPKRRAEAREEGNVAKSHDLAGALILLVITLALWLAAKPMLVQGRGLLGEALSAPPHAAGQLRVEEVWPTVKDLAARALKVAVPLLVIAWIAGFLAHVCQTGWLFTFRAAHPTFGKLNPLRGLKRIFGLSGLMKSGIDTLKVAVVLAIACLTVAQRLPRIEMLPYMPLLSICAEVGGFMFDLALRVLAALVVMGIVDFVHQRHRHSRELRMTRQQVRDEMKQVEGDPDVKRRRMRMQQQIAAQRISSAVPKADVVVTNPEHISIAIKYEEGSMAAPKVVAKGADFLALRIRQIAMRHGIPIVERKPLARALYKGVAVNQEIPPEFYKAVAEILAYVYRLSGRAA